MPMRPCERLFKGSGVEVACVAVRIGDEDLLAPEEIVSLRNALLPVRRRAAAARVAARALLSEAGFPGWVMPRRHGHGPQWPPGMVGSLAHSDSYAVAAVARCKDFAGVGVDIEPAEPLPEDLVDLVFAPGESRSSDYAGLVGRVLFCAKEATYKALHPLDGRFLEHHDVLVDLGSGTAETRYGDRVSIMVHVDHSIIVLARVRVGA